MNRSPVRIVCLFIVVIAALAAAAPAGAASRIVGGDKVDDATFASTYSSVVSVQRTLNPRYFRGTIPDYNTHVCGGVLIAPRLVLTAAHCVDGAGITFDANGYEVLTGHAKLAKTHTTAGRIAVDAVFVHPEYRSSYSNFGYYGVVFGYFYGYGSNLQATFNPYDIAVLRLAAPATGVTPTPIVAAGEDAAVWGNGAGRDSGAVALGWGSPATNNRFSRSTNTLHAVGLPIRADERCERSDGGLELQAAYFDRDEELCAGTGDGPSDGNTAKTTCFGDGGGPLLAPAADGSLRVVGIAPPVATSLCGGWAVFARVAALRSWINSIPADTGGPGGMTPPRDVRGGPTGVNGATVRWSAPATGTPDQYLVYRELSSSLVTRILGSTGEAFVLAGVTNGDGRSIDIDGIAPRRPGQTATRTIRVDVRDVSGNRVEGTPVEVLAPIDARKPTRPGLAGVGRGRWRGGPTVLFTPSTDNDCVSRYLVQLRRGEGVWRTTSKQYLFECERDVFGGYGWGPSNSRPFISQRIGFVAPGHYRLRVVAVDRAGNLTASDTRDVELGRDPDGRRVNTLLS